MKIIIVPVVEVVAMGTTMRSRMVDPSTDEENDRNGCLEKRLNGLRSKFDLVDSA